MRRLTEAHVGTHGAAGDRRTGEVVLWSGDDARARLRDTDFLDAWNRLAADCPFATPFQSADFASVWFETYSTRYEPILIGAVESDGSLDALFALAEEGDGARICAVGAHQAEYQGYLARTDDGRFFLAAMAALARRRPGFELTLKYVLPDVPVMRLRSDRTFRAHAYVATHTRPIWRMEESEVQSSLRKKSNKSKLNRLKRLGELTFGTVTESEEFDRILTSVAPLYDLRQGAINGSVSFRDDPLKRPFHVALSRRVPTFFHTTVMRLDGRVISAHLGATNGTQTHLAIVAHDPSLAHLSPGKMHLMLLAQALCEERRPLFDLTPGGDPWKERFTTDREEAFTLTWYDRPLTRALTTRSTQSQALVRTALKRAGLHEQTRRLRTALSPRIARSTLSALWSDHAVEVYAAPPRLVETLSADGSEGALENAPEALVHYPPDSSAPTRQAFLRSALTNLESGASCYAAALGTPAQRCGWRRSTTRIDLPTLADPIELDGESGVLFDFLLPRDTDAEDACRSMLIRMSVDALAASPARPVYLIAPHGRTSFSALIRELGFVRFASAAGTRRFGRVQRARTD